MTRYFCLFLIILAISACNNQPGGQLPAGDSGVSLQKDSPLLSKPAGDASVRDDLQDDSIFADGSIATSWANAGIGHPIAFKQFLKRLQSWVSNNQKDSVAAVIAFPLKYPPVKNKAAFVANYDGYFNQKVKTALMHQNLRQIFRRDQGAMIGNGELWFNETPGGFTIISINNK